jgi:hypothetical protein
MAGMVGMLEISPTPFVGITLGEVHEEGFFLWYPWAIHL